MNRRLEIILRIISIICCVILFISVLFLPARMKIFYAGWVVLSIAVVAFSSRLVKSGVVETMAALLLGCFLFTMTLIMGISEGSFRWGWMVLRFAIPFLNLPVFWLIGRWIKGNVDLAYRRRAKVAAAEINRILEARIAHKKRMQSRLEQYVGEKREVLSVIRLLQRVSENDSGDALAEMFEQEEGHRTHDFMNGLAALAKKDPDYAKEEFAGRNAFTLLKRITGDIEKCEWRKVNPRLITAADLAPLRKQLKNLQEKAGG